LKTAVITGAGQDAAYLSQSLLSDGYKVICVSRRKSVESGISNIEQYFDNDNFAFINGDITDPTCISKLLHDYKPEEFYNTAAQTHVGYSFTDPVDTFKTNAEAVIMMLELIRQISPKTRFLNFATSEMFGGLNCPQDGYSETTPFNPRSPYAVSKVAAFYATKNYREAYGLHASSSICFNHSSVYRSVDFATRKMTKGIAEVKSGLRKKVKMGDLSAFRDEGHSKDYTSAMRLILAQGEPSDYVVATGSGATIEEMFRYICDLAQLKFEDVYELDERFIRPSEVPFLKGNPLKIMGNLGWKPTYSWKDLLKEMYEYDIQELLWHSKKMEK